MPSSEGSPPSRVSLAIAMDTLVDKLGPDGNGAQDRAGPAIDHLPPIYPPISIALQAPYTYPGPAPGIERPPHEGSGPLAEGPTEGASGQRTAGSGMVSGGRRRPAAADTSGFCTLASSTHHANLSNWRASGDPGPSSGPHHAP